MDRFIVIKNGLVLTLDRKSRAGYFNVILRNDKIFLIDYEKKFNENEFRTKNPDAEIIDAKDKLIMPGLFNSKTISSYTLNKIFFKKCNYENIDSWLSLKLIDNYLSNIQNRKTLSELLRINYSRSLMSGEVFVNECSPSIRKDFFDSSFSNTDWIKQYFNLTTYDYTLLPDSASKLNFVSFGFKTDEDINNYSLSSVKKNISGNRPLLFIEASLTQKAFDSIKKDFGKPFINVLADMEMISGNTVISNPTNLGPGEIEILKKKKSFVLISLSDYINLSETKIDLDSIVLSGVNIVPGTGYTGKDILSELKIFSYMISKNIFSYEDILKTATANPSLLFGVSNLTGSIERNKSADLIFFELNNLKNLLTIPDQESENISEFIIQNLTSSDISHVILKGEILIKDRKEKIVSIENAGEKAKEISDKIYSEGKYFEYKEKYLMRGRVDKLGLNAEKEEAENIKEEIFVDMTETVEYMGEGEFTIIGAKEEEFEKPREKAVEKDVMLNLKEIKSLDSGLNLFEGEEENQELNKPRAIKKQVTAEKDSKTDDKKFKESVKATEAAAEEAERIVEKEDKKIPEFKKTKLKFGFMEDE